ncbi:hypothetical protein AWH49_09420 [Domibacillus aminovorans]|uniref:Uncharacterized protein n=1 Tax=Domibacillus aminovorans TaxID=29332 RepID=A0A177L9Z0_9BACI|nr:hypothetical protein AWH49_09420 [Domibacillus aminovorans]
MVYIIGHPTVFSLASGFQYASPSTLNQRIIEPCALFSRFKIGYKLFGNVLAPVSNLAIASHEWMSPHVRRALFGCLFNRK